MTSASSSPLTTADRAVGEGALSQVRGETRRREARRRRRQDAVAWGVRIGSLIAVLVVWEIYGRSVNRALFAPPSAVAAAGAEMIASGELWSYLRGSLGVLAIGFTAAVLVGIPVGVAMARNRYVGYALEWYVGAFNATPIVALVPLIILMAGFDLKAKSIVVFLSAIFAIVVNTEQGVRNVDRRLLEVARSFRSTERQLWGDVVIPAALPYIAAGLRLAVGRALVGMVVAEFFTSITGIGYLIVRYQNSFQPDHLLVPIVVVMLLGIVLAAITRQVEVWVAPWSRQRDEP